MLNVGVQLSVPIVFAGLVVNVALLPPGRPARLAVSVVIASPSGSAAVICRLSGAFSAPVVSAGAVIAGARSTFATVIATLRERVRLLPPLNVSVYGAARLLSKVGVHV